MTASRWPRPAVAVVLVAWFLYFCWDSVAVKFAPDDLMNLGHYWRLTAAQLGRQFLEPWIGGYRPMGAAFYLPIFRAFGLNPAPFHVGLLAVLLAPYDDMGAFSGRVRVAVPRMGVGERAATMLALVIHELATNSLKYGALSVATGTLDCYFERGLNPWLVMRIGGWSDERMLSTYAHATEEMFDQARRALN